MDDLRIEIWDILYRAEEPKSIDEIADSVNLDSASVREAIDHEWFKVDDDMVTIAEGKSQP